LYDKYYLNIVILNDEIVTKLSYGKGAAMKEETKDRRINVRLDEDTYLAIKKVVEADLRTDISSYCRSLLWISTLHDATVRKIKNAVVKFGKETDTENAEYMLKIKDEIIFIGKFLDKMKQDRKKFDEFIAEIEKWYGTVRDEARKYYSKHNEAIESCEKMMREIYRDEYDTNPTLATKMGDKINI